ncbi:hypothetical protein BKA62DRAFT_47323 [Auriculariales sp. MPI-PUGE-AT-0066]|nr:hypothetical protein BKA62DRAFT_47323 [Auriculariales sp. MPI-PUGE-AT-0066]
MPYPALPGMYFDTEQPWQNLVISIKDRNIASIAFGWTLGFAFFVLLRVFRETQRVGRINTYVIMIWMELFASIVVAFMCYLLLQQVARPSFFFLFFILMAWAIQIQLLLQIIINRICILLDSKRERRLLKWSVAGLMSLLIITTYCIWLPAKLQINHKYTRINEYWDRVEKCIYLVVDAGLNWFFIHKVKKRLVQHGGLKKYQRLVTYNTYIIWVSLAMDCLIIGMMSYPNELVYTMMHPIAYIAKLNIEMAMSHLIIKVARETGIIVNEDSTAHAESTAGAGAGAVRTAKSMQVSVQVTHTRHQDDMELSEQQGKTAWSLQKGSVPYDASIKSTIELSPDSKDRLEV